MNPRLKSDLGFPVEMGGDRHLSSVTHGGVRQCPLFCHPLVSVMGAHPTQTCPVPGGLSDVDTQLWTCFHCLSAEDLPLPSDYREQQ